MGERATFSDCFLEWIGIWIQKSYRAVKDIGICCGRNNLL